MRRAAARHPRAAGNEARGREVSGRRARSRGIQRRVFGPEDLQRRRDPREAAITDVAHGIDGYEDPQKRILCATVGDIRVVNLYVVNGQAVGSEKYAYKLDWLARVAEFLEHEAKRHPNLVVMGDFNIAPDDRDVHDPVAWHEQVLCSTPEREALKRLLGAGLVDSFRLFNEDGGHYSWWDYRQGAFRRNLGLRIDLILASESLRARSTGAGIDREPRTWERASDHTPVSLEITDGSR